MIKVNLTTLEATREPLPKALHGLEQKSLNDLSWTDANLGLRGYGWLKETDVTAEFDHHTHTYDGTETYVVQSGYVEVTKGIRLKNTQELELERIPRFQELERIFNVKSTGLKKLAIDKPWMNDAEAVNNQYRVYEEMYKNALEGKYDVATNNAIITANETIRAQLKDLLLLLNSVRSTIETAITNDDANVDTLLSQADAISLVMVDLTPTKLGEIKTMFGI